MFENPFSFEGRIRRTEYVLSRFYIILIFINPFFFIFCMIKYFKEKSIFRTFETHIEAILYYIVSFIVQCAVIALIFYAVRDFGQIVLTLVVFISYILVFWSLFAQSAKRCHDRGNTGWFQIIPFYGLWMLFADSDYGDNEYGPNPKGIGNNEVEIDDIGKHLVE